MLVPASRTLVGSMTPDSLEPSRAQLAQKTRHGCSFHSQRYLMLYAPTWVGTCETGRCTGLGLVLSQLGPQTRPSWDSSKMVCIWSLDVKPFSSACGLMRPSRISYCSPWASRQPVIIPCGGSRHWKHSCLQVAARYQKESLQYQSSQHACTSLNSTLSGIQSSL